MPTGQSHWHVQGLKMPQPQSPRMFSQPWLGLDEGDSDGIDEGICDGLDEGWPMMRESMQVRVSL